MGLRVVTLEVEDGSLGAHASVAVHARPVTTDGKPVVPRHLLEALLDVRGAVLESGCEEGLDREDAEAADRIILVDLDVAREGEEGVVLAGQPAQVLDLGRPASVGPVDLEAPVPHCLQLPARDRRVSIE